MLEKHDRLPIKLCIMLINIAAFVCSKDKEGISTHSSLHVEAFTNARCREFVRVLHSNAEGQPRSKIKPSKKKGKKWEIVPGDP